MKGYRRHAAFYAAMRWLLAPVLKGYFHFSPAPAPGVDGSAIVIANHTTDFDALFVALSFPKQMYYVASEHIFRAPFLRAFFDCMLAPIPKRKGGADVATAMQMVRRLRAGHNVMLFAEGNKSFDGMPCPVHPATGGMVRASGATLVTYRLTGGYFTHPRWARTLRRGSMAGTPVGVYAPAMLAAMTDAQVNRLIAEDIAEDAYARQQAENIPYRGKRLAEGIENVLYLCPACGALGRIRGQGDAFACDCGLRGQYLPTGYLHGDALPFDTLKSWCAWQREELGRRLAADAAGMRPAAQEKTAPASSEKMPVPVGDTPAQSGHPVPDMLPPTREVQQSRPDAQLPIPIAELPLQAMQPSAHGAQTPAQSVHPVPDTQPPEPPARPPCSPPLLQDAGQTLIRILPDHTTEPVAEGTLSLTADGLACGAFFLPLHDVQGLEIYGRSTLVFSDGAGGRYQVRSAVERSGLKYFEGYQMLRERGN